MKALFQDWFMTIYIVIVVAAAYYGYQTNYEFTTAWDYAFSASVFLFAVSLLFGSERRLTDLAISGATAVFTGFVLIFAVPVLVLVNITAVMGMSLWMSIDAARDADQNLVLRRRSLEEIWRTKSGKFRLFAHIGFPLYVFGAMLLFSTDNLIGLIFLATFPLLNFANIWEERRFKRA